MSIVVPDWIADAIKGAIERDSKRWPYGHHQHGREHIYRAVDNAKGSEAMTREQAIEAFLMEFEASGGDDVTIRGEVAAALAEMLSEPGELIAEGGPVTLGGDQPLTQTVELNPPGKP